MAIIDYENSFSEIIFTRTLLIVCLKIVFFLSLTSDNDDDDDEDVDEDDGFSGDDEVDFSGRFGFWLRRRRIDGSLNRVPVGFYERIWELLHDKNRGPAQLVVLNNSISSSLTLVGLSFVFG